MSNASDFIIENGVLTKYVGPGGDVVIPEGVTRIRDSAFYRCVDVSDITIPDGLTEIGAFAFDKCEKLTKLTMPDTIPTIGACAFRGCDRLADPNGMVIVGNILHYVAPWVTDLVVPEWVVGIKDRALETCSHKLCSAVLPASMKILGKSFCGMFPSLTTIEMPEDLVQIADMAFAGCRALKSVAIPKGVKKIGRYTFENCVSLTNIVLPQELHEIGLGAFYECQSLSEIVIPDMVEKIGEEAFFCTPDGVSHILSTGEIVYYPGGMRYMQVSEKTIEKLGNSAARTVLIQPGMMLAYLQGEFYRNNQAMEKLIVSAINLKKNKEYCIEKLIQADDAAAMDKLLRTLKRITVDEVDQITKRCNDEKKIQLMAFMLQFKKDHFSEVQIQLDKKDKLARDLELREKTLAEWRKEFTIRVVDHTAVIGKYKGSEETVIVPAVVGGNPVIELGEKAFTHCETVRTVYIAEGIKAIGWRVFWGCPNVKEIHIPTSVETIGEQAIQGKKKRIHAPAGSYAETYAKENSIPFVAE